MILGSSPGSIVGGEEGWTGSITTLEPAGTAGPM
jgi:hypothetical protein